MKTSKVIVLLLALLVLLALHLTPTAIIAAGVCAVVAVTLT